MPQIQLPIFPTDCILITPELAFQRQDGVVYYFNGHLPVFQHAVDDIASFRMFTSQLIANGTVTQARISKAFGVPLVSVKRACKKLREEGSAGFFTPKKRREGRKLTPERLELAQSRLEAGRTVPEIGEELGILPNTIHKAISDGRLKKTTPLIVPPA